MPRGARERHVGGERDEAAGDVRATDGERARERPARIRLLETELERIMKSIHASAAS